MKHLNIVVHLFLDYKINLGIVDNLGGKTLERGDLDKLSKSVKLLISFVVVTTPSTQANTDAARYVTYTAAPDELVELGIDTDILGSHRLLGELLDLLDGFRSLLLKGGLVGVLGKVDGVVTGDKSSGFGRGVGHFQKLMGTAGMMGRVCVESEV